MQINLETAWFLAYDLGLFYPACYIVLAASAHVTVSVVGV